MDSKLGEASNRKRVNLTISKKIEILKELDKGSSAKYVAKIFGISCRTVYDIRSNKEKLLQYFSNTDSTTRIFNRKRMREAKSADLDAVLFEWFKQKRSENIPISGPILCQKARDLHKELNIEESCEYTTGWLTKFKNRHGIRYLKATGDKVSADKLAAEEFISEFEKIVSEESLTPEQIYNMDETGLFWCNLPRNTFVGEEEAEPSAVKDDKRRVTVLVCSNAAGTHKCKILVVGKSAHPRSLKGVKVFPVIYKSNRRAWITQELCTEWFQKHFLQEVREHFCKVGLSKECKILLLMDNCTAHPKLVAPNVISLFLPPNTTSLIQPMDQGVINSMKCHYRSAFIKKLLSFHSTGSTLISDFKKEFTIKDCLYMLRESWNSVSQETLVNSWHKLWPQSLFFPTENDDQEFNGFKQSLAKIKVAELMDYAKSRMENLHEDAIEQFLEHDEEPETINHMSDQEIISSVLNLESNNSETESDPDDEEVEEEKILLAEGISLGERYLNFLEKQNIVTDQEILTVYRIQDKLKKETENVLKQTTIDKLFKKKL